MELVKVAAVAENFARNSFKFARYDFYLIELQLDGMGEGVAYSPAGHSSRSYCKFTSMLDRNKNGH